MPRSQATSDPRSLYANVSEPMVLASMSAGTIDHNPLSSDTASSSSSDRTPTVQAAQLAVSRKIRIRFFATFRRDITSKVYPEDGIAILDGNAAAHHGDLITDVSYVGTSPLVDDATFLKLYGVRAAEAKTFTQYKAIVEIFNLHATLTASKDKRKSSEVSFGNLRRYFKCDAVAKDLDRERFPRFLRCIREMDEDARARFRDSVMQRSMIAVYYV